MKNLVILNHKQFFAALLLSLSFAGALQAQTTNNPAPYCESVFTGNYSMFNNINIQGTQLSFGAEGSWSNGNEYAYFTAFNFPSLTKGGNATIELNVYSVDDIEPIYFALWIDFNHNNTFDNNELVMNNQNTILAALPVFDEAEIPITKTISIPATATLGTTRARLVRGNNLADVFGPYDPAFILSPCNSTANGNNNFGNSYDFNLQIIEGNLAASNITTSDEKVVFYPNPANETISFKILSPEEYTFFQIQDLTGRIVKTVEVDNELTTLSLLDLPNGLYTILAMSKKENNFLDKIVIKH